MAEIHDKQLEAGLGRKVKEEAASSRNEILETGPEAAQQPPQIRKTMATHKVLLVVSLFLFFGYGMVHASRLQALSCRKHGRHDSSKNLGIGQAQGQGPTTLAESSRISGTWDRLNALVHNYLPSMEQRDQSHHKRKTLHRKQADTVVTSRFTTLTFGTTSTFTLPNIPGDVQGEATSTPLTSSTSESNSGSGADLPTTSVGITPDPQTTSSTSTSSSTSSSVPPPTSSSSITSSSSSFSSSSTTSVPPPPTISSSSSLSSSSSGESTTSVKTSSISSSSSSLSSRSQTSSSSSTSSSTTQFASSTSSTSSSSSSSTKRLTSSEVRETFTHVLPKGGVTTITSTSWVQVEATEPVQAQATRKPDLQNDAPCGRVVNVRAGVLAGAAGLLFVL